MGRSAIVRHGRCFARGTDLDTTRRLERTDVKSKIGQVVWLKDVNRGRAEDAQVAEVLGAPFTLPA